MPTPVSCWAVRRSTHRDTLARQRYAHVLAATGCKRRLNSRGNSTGRFPPICVTLICRKSTSLAQSPVLQGLGDITFMGLQELMGRSVRESTASRRNKHGNGIDRIRPLLWLLFRRPAKLFCHADFLREALLQVQLQRAKASRCSSSYQSNLSCKVQRAKV